MLALVALIVGSGSSVSPGNVSPLQPLKDCLLERRVEKVRLIGGAGGGEGASFRRPLSLQLKNRSIAGGATRTVPDG